MPLSPAEEERIESAIKNRDLPSIISILKAHKGAYQYLDPFYIALSVAKSDAAVLILKDYLANNKAKLTPQFVNNPFFQDNFAPIHLACRMGDLELLNLLLSIKGIDVNAKTPTGYHALWAAASLDLAALVKCLLAVEGIKVDEAAADNATPLVIACIKQHHEVAKLLIRTGKVDVNRLISMKGWGEVLGITQASPLASALIESPDHNLKCDLELVKMLVRAGASLTIDGQDILVKFISSEEAEAYIRRIQVLRTAQGYQQSQELFFKKKELFELIEAKDEASQVDKIKSLIAKYPVLLSALDEHSEPPKEGDSPLHRACRLGRVLIADALLAAGDDVNRIKASSNGTPLYMAAQGGHTEVVRLLATKWKAKVDVPNIYKDTALIIAADKNYIDMAKILVTAGANINHINGKEKSCLDVATKHPELAKLLKEKGALPAAELKAKQNGGAAVQINGPANGKSTQNGSEKPIVVTPSAAKPAALSSATPTKPLPATPKSPAVIAASTGFHSSNPTNSRSNGYSNGNSRDVVLPMNIPGVVHTNDSASSYTPPSPPKVM